ncbi:MAG: HlyD family efflux transporter periplasmic adaptor subunit [Rickettsiales bacterium]
MSTPSKNHVSLSKLHDFFVMIFIPEKAFYRLAIIYGVAISLFTLAVPISVQMLITTLTNTALIRPVAILSFILFGILSVYALLTALQYYIMELFKRRFFARIVSEIALRNIHAAQDPTMDRSALANRYFEIMTVQHKLPILITSGFALMLQTLVGLILVSSYHPALLVFNVIFVLLVYLLWRWFAPTATRRILKLSKEKYAVAAWLDHLARSNPDSHTAQVATQEIYRSNQVIESYLTARTKFFIPEFRQTVGFLLLYALASASLVGVGGTLVVSGELTLGQLVAAELVLSTIFFGMSKAGEYLSHYYDLCAAVEKLSQFFLIPVKNAEENTNPIDAKFDRSGFTAFLKLKPPRITRTVAYMLISAIISLIVFLTFTPWIQTAFGAGKITALDPADRAQTISSLVKGRINRWYVNDGSLVKKDDPIAEIIDNDPQLIARLQSERDAMGHKLETTRLAMETSELNHNRQMNLSNQGLSSNKEYEQARIRWKELKADVAQAQADLNKVEVQLARQHTQLVRAPRDGYVLQILAGGVSTHVKEGDALATFVPKDATPAVELYVSGLDVPLIHPGRKVRLIFEGWPSIQFSGWPSVAVGTFGGEVIAVDSTISPNGRFRVLIAPSKDEPWPGPQFLRMGAQVKGWVLLNEVPIGYELWRQMNSFPPVYDTETAFSGKNSSQGTDKPSMEKQR